MPEIEGAFTGILGYEPPLFYIEAWHFDDEMERRYRKRMKAKFASALQHTSVTSSDCEAASWQIAGLKIRTTAGQPNTSVSSGSGATSRGRTAPT